MVVHCIGSMQVVVGQWSTGTEKTNEPTLLRRHLEALLDTYPMLRLITGDAIFAQRPLAELICAKNCNYLLQIKATRSMLLSTALPKRSIARLQPRSRTGNPSGSFALCPPALAH